MLPPSLAFAWLNWRRVRSGLPVFLSILLVEAVLSAVLPPYCSHEIAIGAVGLVLAVTLPTVALCLLLAFCHGAENADVLGRESCFPTHLLRLPVGTCSLVIWPVIYGAVVAAIFWLATAWFILRPWLALSNDTVPLWWPALIATAALAWIQAVLWSSFGLRRVRVIVLLALLPSLSTMVGVSIHSGMSEGLLTSLYAGLTLIGWLAAYVGVKHARRGDVPDWSAFLWPLCHFVRTWPKRRLAFGTATQALTSFEWRSTGLSLPTMTALVLPVTLWPLMFGKNDVLPVAQTLLSALALPVLLAGFAGAWPGIGRNRWVKDRAGMTPFVATLPMSTVEMIGAMLKVAVWSTLMTWAFVVMAVTLAVVLTGTLDEVAEQWRQVLKNRSSFQVAAGTLAILAWLLIATWKRKVDSLYLSLTGRTWVSVSVALMCMPGAPGLCVVVVWIYKTPEMHQTALAVLPWLLGVIVLCRLLLAGWALVQVLRKGLMEVHTAIHWLVAWLLVASVLFGLLAFAMPSNLVPVYYVAFAILFAMPMARLAASPLALAWNRHR
jgi:hypothetical protein